MAGEVEAAAQAAGGDSVDGEDVDVYAAEEWEVGAFQDGRGGVLELGEGEGIRLVELGADEFHGPGQPLGGVGDEAVVVGAWHGDVHVVVPGDEACVAHGPEHGACGGVPAQAVFAAHFLELPEQFQGTQLQRSDVVFHDEQGTINNEQ